MDILIRLAEIGSNKKTFVFPSNPESISGTIGAKYQSFDIISKGTIRCTKILLSRAKPMYGTAS